MESYSNVAACYQVGRYEAQAACNLLLKVDLDVRNELERLVRTKLFCRVQNGCGFHGRMWPWLLNRQPAGFTQ